MPGDDVEPRRASGPDVGVPDSASLRPHRYAIASGKGGVGKTWLAISLATVFARSGKRTLLVDGDLGLANVDVQLGLAPDRDLGGLLQGGTTLEDVVTRFHAGQFDVLAGRAGSGSLASLSAMSLERLLLNLAESSAYDVILFDLGAGIDRHVRRMACWVDTLVVVATDEPTSLTDAYVVLKIHATDKRRLSVTRDGAPITDARIVVNQAATHLAGMQTYETLRRVCSSYLQFSPASAGVVRRDDRVRDAIRSQVAFPLRYPIAAAAVDIEQVALSLCRFGSSVHSPHGA